MVKFLIFPITHCLHCTTSCTTGCTTGCTARTGCMNKSGCTTGWVNYIEMSPAKRWLSSPAGCVNWLQTVHRLEAIIDRCLFSAVSDGLKCRRVQITWGHHSHSRRHRRHGIYVTRRVSVCQEPTGTGAKSHADSKLQSTDQPHHKHHHHHSHGHRHHHGHQHHRSEHSAKHHSTGSSSGKSVQDNSTAREETAGRQTQSAAAAAATTSAGGRSVTAQYAIDSSTGNGSLRKIIIINIINFFKLSVFF